MLWTSYCPPGMVQPFISSNSVVNQSVSPQGGTHLPILQKDFHNNPRLHWSCPHSEFLWHIYTLFIQTMSHMKSDKKILATVRRYFEDLCPSLWLNASWGVIAMLAHHGALGTFAGWFLGKCFISMLCHIQTSLSLIGTEVVTIIFYMCVFHTFPLMFPFSCLSLIWDTWSF
jgi:hypothetical protein